jgi:Flp pilus assembly protein TadG
MIAVRERARGPGTGPDRERGTSVIELVMYMPFLVFMIFLTLQLTFMFLGNQAAGAAAREAARVARSAGDPEAGSAAALSAGQERGLQYAASTAPGLIHDVRVQVEAVNDDGLQVRATVTAKGVQLVPGMPGMDIRKVVQGPVEAFRPDNGVAP